MKIKLFCFNKLSKEYLEIYNYYFTKVKKYSDLEVVEIAEFDSGDVKSNQAKNEENLNKKLVDLKDWEVFLLEINAKQYESESFSKLIQDNKDFKGAKLAFIIGPSDGFSYEFRKSCKNQLSFGNMTYPYSLIRIILLEQIFRSIKIMRKEPYHK
ncbi:23S rRNA (pseudouridine1915-N3)-methyltransferase H [Spiroplasma chinense]|uniref:Ribosomal RNA large subunit methyltransferase H n=1 Tax=Spiroplasma chinense TaxID=216932 RepID=A0A5B9Y4F1_9MOLU|nr:23S rRNA (pseudouridine(1915)-N(3))-methyltransferase RlmH [Spiroplasma chinense]QEH61643.1 23S rRNA (pseudouridine1915-N3)-methyltransferase H [Spiroplasma chinense]